MFLFLPAPDGLFFPWIFNTGRRRARRGLVVQGVIAEAGAGTGPRRLMLLFLSMLGSIDSHMGLLQCLGCGDGGHRRRF